MAYAIMRCKKLKSLGSVAASLQHCYRERETPNADASRTPQNDHYGASSTSSAMGALKALLPEKRRKDAVLAIEYIMTASPEWWESASKQQQDDFFERSRKWLADKFGAQNVIVSTIHRDETSPHLSAYVVPLKEGGRLAAKDFIGGRNALRQDQTTYAAAVRSLGLERGIEGSKAKHTTIQQYYARVSEPLPAIKPLNVPEPTLMERMNPTAYRERVRQAVAAHVKPMRTLHAQAQEMLVAKAEAKAAREQSAASQRESAAYRFEMELTKKELRRAKEDLALFTPEEIRQRRSLLAQQEERLAQELMRKPVEQLKVAVTAEGVPESKKRSERVLTGQNDYDPAP